MERNTTSANTEGGGLVSMNVPSKSGRVRGLVSSIRRHHTWPYRICPRGGVVGVLYLSWPNNNTGLVVPCRDAYDNGRRCPKGREYLCQFQPYPTVGHTVEELLQVVKYEQVIGDTRRVFNRYDPIGQDTQESLVFFKGDREVDTSAGVIICRTGIRILEEEDRTFILTKDPRLEFIRWLREVFPRREGIHPTAQIADCVRVGERVYVGPNSVIGEQGFGYGREGDGTLSHFPHIGGVVIEDDVDICTGVIIDRGTLGNTVIGEGSKLNNASMIGHNVQIGKRCIVGAHASIHGGAILEDDVYIAPGVRVRKQRIGRGSTIGMQAAVLKDIPPDVTAFGVPARVKE